MPNTPDEELVRRLLADARHDEPVPADVVARLDGVLADLAAEEGRTAVAPLRRPHHPHRRRWAAGLVAAAVVVVGGFTLRSVWPEGSHTSSSASSAGDSSDSAAAGGRKVPGSSPEGFAIVTPQVADLHRASLEDDVRRAVSGLPAQLASPPAAASPPASFTCVAGPWGVGSGIPARLDGSDAMLVLRTPAHGKQVAEVLQCGTGRVLASVTLPAR